MFRRRCSCNPLKSAVVLPPLNHARRPSERVYLFEKGFWRLAVLMWAAGLFSPVLETKSVKDWFPVVDGRSRMFATEKLPKERVVWGPVSLSEELLKTKFDPVVKVMFPPIDPPPPRAAALEMVTGVEPRAPVTRRVPESTVVAPV